MLPRNDLDRIQIAFDDHRLVANWDWASWRTATLTWEMRSVGQTREISC